MITWLTFLLGDLDFCCVFDLLGHLAPFVRTLGCFLCIVILKILAASPPPSPLLAGHVCLPLVQRFAAGFCPETNCSWYCVYATCCVIFGTLLVFSITCGSCMSTICSTGIRSSCEQLERSASPYDSALSTAHFFSVGHRLDIATVVQLCEVVHHGGHFVVHFRVSLDSSSAVMTSSGSMIVTFLAWS